jgi:hypothetical protein
MFRWLFRVFLLRFLPRRLLPILTVVELVRMVRGMRRSGHAVNQPTESRSARPARMSSPDAETGVAPPSAGGAGSPPPA